MSSRSVVTVTTGVSGSGKTYYRCAVFLVDEWLPNHEGKLISNYPLKLDALVSEFGEGVLDRVEIIPDSVLSEWREGRSGPWDYFAGRDISGCHIAIDEIHNYCPKTADNKLRKKWMMFVGEIRHQGATIEFLTQNEAKCAKELLAEAEIRFEIINGENLRFPVLRYRMGDLYEFRAKLLGKYLCPSYCVEYQQGAGGDWVQIDSRPFFRLPKYFQYYDSYSAPEHGQALGHKAEPRPWEKYSWPRLFLWFYLTYPIRISFHVTVAVVFCWLFFCGGLTGCYSSYFGYLRKLSNGKSGSQNQKVVENQTQSSDRKVREESSVHSSGRIVRVDEPWVVCAPDYLRFQDGSEYWSGDECWGSRIYAFDPRTRAVILEDGFFFPISWLRMDGEVF